MIFGMRGAVVIDVAEAQALAAALKWSVAALSKQGVSAPAQLAPIQVSLANACANASDESNVIGSEAGQRDSPQTDHRDLVDTAAAARILGCSTANVRDLARRGRIPARRSGGRWLYPAAAVTDRAGQSANRFADWTHTR